MGQTPDLRQNLDLGMERQKKILELITIWYKAAAQTDPPPVTDPSILSYNSKVTYYYTAEIVNRNVILNLVNAGLQAAVAGISGVVIPFDIISNLVSQSLAETTQSETSQGYSTCVMSSFEGEFQGRRCLYKPMVVAVSFNFSASEYQSSANVAAFGYWVYLFCTAPPFRSGEAGFGELNETPRRYRSIEGVPLAFQLPDDMSVVGKKYMTLKELDAFRPTSFTRSASGYNYD